MIIGSKGIGMTKEEMVELANKASKEWLKEFPTHLETANQVPERYLEIFAKMVIAKEQDKICRQIASLHDSIMLASHSTLTKKS